MDSVIIEKTLSGPQSVHLEVRDPGVLLAVAISLVAALSSPAELTNPSVNLAEAFAGVPQLVHSSFDLTTDFKVLRVFHLIVPATRNEATNGVVAKIHVDRTLGRLDFVISD
jgi:hypothetical protein